MCRLREPTFNLERLNHERWVLQFWRELVHICRLVDAYVFVQIFKLSSHHNGTHSSPDETRIQKTNNCDD